MLKRYCWKIITLLRIKIWPSFMRLRFTTIWASYRKLFHKKLYLKDRIRFLQTLIFFVKIKEADQNGLQRKRLAHNFSNYQSCCQCNSGFSEKPFYNASSHYKVKKRASTFLLKPHHFSTFWSIYIHPPPQTRKAKKFSKELIGFCN